MEERCKASGVAYETFDLYESRDETRRRRDRLRTQIKRFVFFSYVKLKRCACSHNITLYLPPLITHFERSTERRDNEEIREAERFRRVLDEARYAAFGHCRDFRPKCVVCPKINSRNFENEDERRLHTAVEFYETFYGVKYERMLRDSFDRGFAEPWNRTHWQLIIHRIQSHNNSVVCYCSSCEECWNDLFVDLDKRPKVLDLVEERRPLIFDFKCGGKDDSKIDAMIERLHILSAEICGE